jgi:cyanophycin synthetase
MHFARGDTARVPVIAVAGPGDKIAAAGMSAAIMTASGLTTALAGPQGVSVGTERFREGPCREEQFVGGALSNPLTEAAVFEFPYDGLVRRGIPIDACDVAAITAGATMPPSDGRTMKAKLAAIASRYIVLDVADNDAVQIAGSARVPVCWIAHDANNPLVKAHLAAGGLAVAAGGNGANGRIEVLRGAQAPDPVLPLPVSNAASANEYPEAITQLLFAAAIGVVSGVAPEHIRNGIESCGTG